MAKTPAQGEADGLPPDLRLLKILVTTLTATLILGVIVIIGLLVIRLPAAVRPTPLVLPDQISLPEGARAEAFTQGRDWYAVVTEAGEILIYDRASGALRQRVATRP